VAEASIPVDLLNPGQVFACLGLVEAADTLLGGAEGCFDWSDPAGVRFWLRAQGEAPPVAAVLGFLAEAQAIPVAIEGSRNLAGWTPSWGPMPSRLSRDEGYPFPDPDSPATLVCALRAGAQEIRIDHWGDQTGRDNVKFWAGAAGYPGVALARDALELVRAEALNVQHNPFSFAAPQSSSFRFDWRRDYIPIHAGFSLNKHANIETLGFPLVELLAAIGLTHARPLRPGRRDKLTYHYAVVGRSTSEALWLPPSVLRSALGCAALPFSTRRFCMHLGWPGKEGQARSITTVVEETAP